MKNQKTKLPGRIERYLAQQELYCKASTVGTYRVALKPFCDFLISEMKSNTITKQEIACLSRKHLQKYLRRLCDKPLAAYSRVNYLLAIRKYLEWEISHETVDEGIIAGFDRYAIPKVPEYLPRPLSAENDRFLAQKLAKSNHRYAPMFRLLRLTGMRISELINLKKDCLLSTSHGACFLKVPLGKMNNERMVPLHQEAIDIIDKIKTDAQLRLISDDVPNDSIISDRLIAIDGSVCAVYNRLRHQFKKITGDIIDQGKPITFHRLRHTYATSLLSAGVGIFSIMKLLGHRRIEMTMRYTRVVPSALRNEYLRAVDLMKSVWDPQQDDSLDITYPIDPADLFDMLKKSIRKLIDLDPNSRRNLVKRIDRLSDDISALSPICHNHRNHQSADSLAG